jgi:hypothetical protein
MKTTDKIVSFLRKNPCLTYTEVSREFGVSYNTVNGIAARAGMKAMDRHAARNEAIVSLIKLNPTVPYHRLGKALGLNHPRISGIATQAGIYRHVARNAAATRKREREIVHSLRKGRTFSEAAIENGCGKNAVWLTAKKYGIRRPGCPPLSYTKAEEERAVRWLHHRSFSHSHIAKKVGMKHYTVSNIAARNGIRRRLPSLYRGEVPHFS